MSLGPSAPQSALAHLRLEEAREIIKRMRAVTSVVVADF